MSDSGGSKSNVVPIKSFDDAMAEISHGPFSDPYHDVSIDDIYDSLGVGESNNQEAERATDEPPKSSKVQTGTIEKKIKGVKREIPIIESFVEMPDSIMKTVIGRLARLTAQCLEFPEASTFTSLLASASASVSTAYATEYATKSPVSGGIYAIIEQPPATQKSRLLGVGMRPYEEAMKRHNKFVGAKNMELAERTGADDATPMRRSFTVSTDATTAALDGNLTTCSEGRFVIASAEQSAFISMFPEKGSFASTNELLLKGWAGEYVSGMRSTRKAFSGMAYGATVLIAQPGSAKRVLSASNGTGLAERFLYLSEPSMLGSRELLGKYMPKTDIAPFMNACMSCVDEYSRIAYERWQDDPYSPLEPDDLIKVSATPAGYQYILDLRRQMEPVLGELNRAGELVTVGWLGKFETHVLKVALTLHVIDRLSRKQDIDLIPLETIQASCDYILVMRDHLSFLLGAELESGRGAEEAAFIEVLTHGAMNRRAILQKLRNRSPFRAMGRDAYRAAGERLDAMVKAETLVVNTKGLIELV